VDVLEHYKITFLEGESATAGIGETVSFMLRAGVGFAEGTEVIRQLLQPVGIGFGPGVLELFACPMVTA
jgi:hypothetical protein